MALGGVETGSINAQEDAMVAGSIRISGEISVCEAKVANTGKNVAATAVLDVNSVNKVIDKQIINSSSGNGKLPRIFKFCAI